jgi:hypothetical protein
VLSLSDAGNVKCAATAGHMKLKSLREQKMRMTSQKKTKLKL